VPKTRIDHEITTDGRRRTWLTPWRAFLLGWAAAFLIGSAWAIVSPMASSPDEPSHILKAEATVRGQFTGTPTKSQGLTDVDVPKDLIGPGSNITCYVFNGAQNASCLKRQHVEDDNTLVEQGTGVGDYNPLYYGVVGWPSLFLHGNKAWFAMRLMSALLNSFFIGILFFVASQLRRTPAFLAWVATALTPMTLYLTGMVNPNSVEIVGCGALAAVAWLIVSDRTRSQLGVRMTFLAIAGVVAGNTRALSPGYVGIILIAVLISFPFRRSADLIRRPAVWIGLGVGAVGLIAAAAWTLLISGPAGFLPTNTPRDGLVRAFIQTLRNTSDFGRMMIGRLGWLDTPLPDVVYVGWTVGIGFLVVAVVLVGFRRATLGALLLMLAVLFVPAVVQSPSVKTFGYIWQGRYTLPVFVAMILVAGIVVERTVLRRVDPRRIVAVLGFAAMLGQFVAWFTAYKRYAIGLPGSWRALLHPTPWSPPGGLVPITVVFLVGTIGMWVLSILISRTIVRDDGLTGFDPEIVLEPDADLAVAPTTDTASTPVPDTADTAPTAVVQDDAPVVDDILPPAAGEPGTELLESPGADPRTEDPRSVGVHPGPAR
jgi:hypothetical protein